MSERTFLYDHVLYELEAKARIAGQLGDMLALPADVALELTLGYRAHIEAHLEDHIQAHLDDECAKLRVEALDRMHAQLTELRSALATWLLWYDHNPSRDNGLVEVNEEDILELRKVLMTQLADEGKMA